MGSPTINGGHLHYRRHKKKVQPALTEAKLEHLIFLKRCQIQNYERHTERVDAYMERLQNELKSLEKQLEELP